MKGLTVEQRFRAKVDTSHDCWMWLGAKDKDGYGVFKPDTRRSSPNRSRAVRAHRFAAQLAFGMFDTRALVCHTCDVPSCVRPAHLYLGDPVSNSRDRIHRGRDFNANKTHCNRGHEYTAENTLWRGHQRACRECAYASNRRWWARNRASSADTCGRP
jgi:hypothetical protein